MCVFQERTSGGKRFEMSVLRQFSRQESEKLLVKSPVDEPSVDDLKNLCALKGDDVKASILASYGGVEQLAQRLGTNLQEGLDETAKAEIKRRATKFGKNEIPTTDSKTFFTLVINALKDATLIMLMMCAFISIGLAFYHAQDEDENEFAQPKNLTSSSSTLRANNVTQAHSSTDETSIQWIEGIYPFYKT